MLPIVEQMMSFVRKGSADKRGRSEDREERVRRGLELAPVGIALATLDGHWLYVNDRFGAMTGYAREQLARFSFDHLTHPDDARRESAFLRKLLDAEIESFRIVKRVMSRGGEYNTVEALTTVARTAAGRPDFLIHIIDDPPPAPLPTTLRDVDQALVAVLDSLEDIAIVRTDARGLITSWNRGAERLLGYKRDEAIGRSRKMLYRDADTWDGRPTQQLNAVVEHGQIATDDWRVTRDGAHLWTRTTITPVKPGGVLRGYVEVITAASNGSREDTQAIAQQKKTTTETRVAELKRTIETMRAELTKREKTEESLREALHEVRVVGEETLDELKIMTGALRKELDRRKAAEEEVRGLGEQLAAVRSAIGVQEAQRVVEPEPVVAPELEVVAAARDEREWKTLDGTTTAELLIAHGSAQLTGTLIVASGDAERQIFLEKGRIYSSASNDPASFLAQRLITRGILTEEQRGRAIEIQHETHLALGRILMILGAVTESQLLETMRIKTEEEIASIFDWTDARYVFVEGEIPTTQLVPLRLEVATLVVQRLNRRATIEDNEADEVMAASRIALPHAQAEESDVLRIVALDDVAQIAAGEQLELVADAPPQSAGTMVVELADAAQTTTVQAPTAQLSLHAMDDDVKVVVELEANRAQELTETGADMIDLAPRNDVHLVAEEIAMPEGAADAIVDEFYVDHAVSAPMAAARSTTLLIASSSAKSRKFHREDCNAVARISAKSRRTFDSSAAALAQQLEPCRVCLR